MGGDASEEGEFSAVVHAMGRSNVSVVVGGFMKTHAEAARPVHLAVGMPANDRMDWLVEKATELGVTSIAPLMTERSVLRLSGERLEKKLLHWRAVATAACEQCGRSRVPRIHAPTSLSVYLKTLSNHPPAARHAKKMVVHMRYFIKWCFKQKVMLNLPDLEILDNLHDLVEKKANRKPVMRIYDEKTEVQPMIAAAKEISTRALLMLLLGVRLGLRKNSEALSLTWNDVDLKRHRQAEGTSADAGPVPGQRHP